MADPRDPTRAVEIAGPWEHRYVAANGARFHVVEASGAPAGAPLVLLLHGFPEFWWAWRAQLPALAAAGYRAVAMDLRGYGGSDKTPNGYDPLTLAQDVAGVVKALGAQRAVLVGQGWGGYIAWTAARQHPGLVTALATVSAPHPTTMLEQVRRLLSPRGEHRVMALQHVLAMQVPMVPERRLADASSGFLREHLRDWAAPGSDFPSDEVAATYQTAIALWPASHCALEYHRWLFRSRLRADGRAFSRLMRPAVTQPVLCLAGDLDPALPRRALPDSGEHVSGPFEMHLVPGVGHFCQEENPEAVNALLLDWLARLSR